MPLEGHRPSTSSIGSGKGGRRKKEEAINRHYEGWETLSCKYNGEGGGKSGRRNGDGNGDGNGNDVKETHDAKVV